MKAAICIKHRTAVGKDGKCRKCADQRRVQRVKLSRLGQDVPISMREFRQYGDLLWKTS